MRRLEAKNGKLPFFAKSFARYHKAQVSHDKEKERKKAERRRDE